MQNFWKKIKSIFSLKNIPKCEKNLKNSALNLIIFFKKHFAEIKKKHSYLYTK